LSNQAALVIENSRLLERLSERVVQSESDLAITNQHLRAEKNTLQTVLHSMTDGVVVTDTDGFIQLINPAAAALLPELNIEAIGRPLAEMLQSEWAPEGTQHIFSGQTEAGVRQVLAARGEGRMAIQLIRGDVDAPHIIEAHSAPLRNEDGKPIGIVSVFADVTEQRGIEQAKSDFVSFVAHEMRSPLTSIAGFSSMLQRQEVTPASTQNAAQTRATRARFLGIIHSESERLTRLINNLLDVARIEAGRGIELHREPTNFSLLAAETIESQQSYSSRHQLVNSVPHSLPAVVADRDKVMQILINLISNALKYSPGGTIELSAQVEGKFLKISVRDEGPGIPPDEQERLFQRFSRAPSRSVGTGQKAKPTGTGLGLFLTRYLVESHSGQIWVESEVGKGSTFHFTLPLA
jgi:PAS domain S-box-containing protein